MHRIRIISLLLFMLYVISSCKKGQEEDLQYYDLETKKQTFLITYIANSIDCTGDVPSQTKFLAGESCVVSDNTGNMAVQNYRFVGWNTKADGTGETFKPGDKYSKLSDLTLYAMWIEMDKYVITYNSNNVQVPDSLLNSTIFRAEYGAQILHDLGRQGEYSEYQFLGWNTSADGTGQSYSVGDEYAEASDLQLYAQWKQVVFKIAYVSLGVTPNNAMPQTMYYEPGKSDGIVIPDELESDEYTFRGWYSLTAEGDTVFYKSGVKYTFDTDIVIFAKWVPFEVIVTYCNIIDGEVVATIYKTLHTKAVVLEGSDMFSREHYTIYNWTTLADGGDTIDLHGLYYCTKNFNVYTNWVVTESFVTVDLNGGAGVLPQTTLYKVGEKVPTDISLATYYDNNYNYGELIGWSTDKDATEPDRVPYTIDIYNDLNTTLYAVWKKINTQYVDLGLPSGTLWATNDLDGLYAWGETEPKSEFTKNNYKYYSDNQYTKYVEGDLVLEESDDAANAQLGKPWYMPSADEYKELLEYCTVSANSSEVVLTSTINGNTLTFSKSYYWTKSMRSSSYSFSKDAVESGSATIEEEVVPDDVYYFVPEKLELIQSLPRYNGMNVRAVRKQNYVSNEKMEDDDL